MFDFNCDLTSDKNIEMANFASTINIKNTDVSYIKSAFDIAKKREVALSSLIYDIENLDGDELQNSVIYQISSLVGYSNVYSLKIENITFLGATKEKMNNDINFARKVVSAISKVDSWFNIILNNNEFIEILSSEFNLKFALEVAFHSKMSIREVREMPKCPQTLHFETLEDIKRAIDVIKPTPISYNRVFEVL